MVNPVDKMRRYIKYMTKNLHPPSYDQPCMTKPQPNLHQPMTKCFPDQPCDQLHAVTNPMNNETDEPSTIFLLDQSCDQCHDRCHMVFNLS